MTIKATVIEGGVAVRIKEVPDGYRFDLSLNVRPFDPILDAGLVDHMAELRAERDSRLAKCDHTQLPDAPFDQEAWAIYRQALRDLPASTIDPASPDWPIEPGGS